MGYSTTVRYLHELGYNLRVPRPWPERQKEEERNAFLVQLRTWQADPTIELWFADECGVEGDPRPRRRWSAREIYERCWTGAWALAFVAGLYPSNVVGAARASNIRLSLT